MAQIAKIAEIAEIADIEKTIKVTEVAILTQAEYKRRLAKGIARLSAERKRGIEEDITNHFAEGLADGVSEEKLCEILGEPETLAKEYAAQSALGEAEDRTTIRSVMRAVWAGLGMGLVNLIFALPVFLGIFGVWIGIVAATAGCLLGGAASVVCVLLYALPAVRNIVYIEYLGVTFFGGLAAAALGGLGLIFTVRTTRALLRGLLKYVRMNVDVVAGRKRVRE